MRVRLSPGQVSPGDWMPDGDSSLGKSSSLISDRRGGSNVRQGRDPLINL